MADDPITATLNRLRDEMITAANVLTPGLSPEKALAAGALHGAALKALGGLDAALSRHRPVQLHGRVGDFRGNVTCGHDADYDGDAHYEGDDGEWYCESLPSAVACSGCPESPDGEYADWPCPEYTAILTELTGKERELHA